ncbi:MAG: DUF3343 domain-containing protein [Oscillospiraceae bacterium]|nr:DUF3343 domain-containing protein [Oscillospiraceae bacterium]
MATYLILCRSLTYAQKAARALERVGITATILRTPKGLSQEGCSYCVRVSERSITIAMTALRETNAKITRVYVCHPTGEIREVAR